MDGETKDYVVLQDIKCVGSDGSVFEEYPLLHIAKEVIKRDETRPRKFTLLEGIAYFDSKPEFLPSFALTCNILARCYEKREEPEYKSILAQYAGIGTGRGWYAQNTIIDAQNKKIIHYPQEDDFPTKYTRAIKKDQHIIKEFPDIFDRKTLPLEEALKDASKRTFMQELSGLVEPELLCTIAQYIGRQAVFWPPSNASVHTTSIGFDDRIYIHAAGGVDYIGQIRPVSKVCNYKKAA